MAVDPSALSTLGQAAVRAAARGYHVFPLRPGDKKPLTRHGFKDASADPALAAERWAAAPDANLGLATGERSNLFVLDLDVRPGKDGLAAASRLEVEVGELPVTCAVRTAGGGRHLWFAWDPRLATATSRAGKLGPGIDWRGNGGYVVAPPSVAAGGGGWEFSVLAPIAALPEAWVRRILSATASPVPSSAPGPIPSRARGPRKFAAGERNDSLFRQACAWRGHGWDHDRILAGLVALNAERCDPPLGEDEMRQVAASAAAYPARQYHETTDRGNAYRFRDLFAGRATHCAPLRSWYVWDGTRWEPDPSGAIALRLATTVPDAIREEGWNAPTAIQQGALERWAISSQANARLQAIVRIAGPLVPVNVGHLDSDQYLLNAPNGTVDLRTGELRPHDPADRLTKLSGAKWDPSARCAVWEEMAVRLLPDPEVRSFFQRAVGYTLVGGQEAKAFFVVWGPQDSGKSTAMNAVRRALGDYADVSSYGVFAGERTSDANTPGLATLVGTRLVVIPEVPDVGRLATGLVKQWTGGDAMQATQKYALPFRFDPVGKLWFVGNVRPQVPRGDDAAWRRLLIVPFPHSIPRDQQDPGIIDRISPEGVLAWAWAGLLEYRRFGLAPPAAVHAATSEYQEEVDPLADFLEERVRRDRGARERLVDVYRAYASWCDELRQRPISQREFARDLRANGIEVARVSGSRRALGVRLVSPGAAEGVLT